MLTTKLHVGQQAYQEGTITFIYLAYKYKKWLWKLVGFALRKIGKDNLQSATKVIWITKCIIEL